MSYPIICIGGALVDELLYAADDIVMRTTNLGVTARKSAGGVGRNIAHQLSLLGMPVHLISVFGNDSDGAWLKQECANAGMHLAASVTAPADTGKYTGIINADGSLFTAFITNASERLITPGYLESRQSLLRTAAYLLADTNLSVETIQWIIDFSNQTNIPLVIEPVSVDPAKKLSAVNLNGVYLITPNEDELPAICNSDFANTEKQIEKLLSLGIQNIWLHKGAEGSVLYNNEYTLPLSAPAVDVIDCTGAGDASVAGFLAAKYAGKDDMEALKTGHSLAAEILQVNGAIAIHLDKQQLQQLVPKYYAE